MNRLSIFFILFVVFLFSGCEKNPTVETLNRDATRLCQTEIVNRLNADISKNAEHNSFLDGENGILIVSRGVWKILPEGWEKLKPSSMIKAGRFFTVGSISYFVEKVFFGNISTAKDSFRSSMNLTLRREQMYIEECPGICISYFLPISGSSTNISYNAIQKNLNSKQVPIEFDYFLLSNQKGECDVKYIPITRPLYWNSSAKCWELDEITGASVTVKVNAKPCSWKKELHGVEQLTVLLKTKGIQKHKDLWMDSNSIEISKKLDQGLFFDGSVWVDREEFDQTQNIEMAIKLFKKNNNLANLGHSISENLKATNKEAAISCGEAVFLYILRQIETKAKKNSNAYGESEKQFDSFRKTISSEELKVFKTKTVEEHMALLEEYFEGLHKSQVEREQKERHKIAEAKRAKQLEAIRKSEKKQLEAICESEKKLLAYETGLKLLERMPKTEKECAELRYVFRKLTPAPSVVLLNNISCLCYVIAVRNNYQTEICNNIDAVGNYYHATLLSTCPVCNGKGAPADACSTCNGTGVCTLCNGLGRLSSCDASGNTYSKSCKTYCSNCSGKVNLCLRCHGKKKVIIPENLDKIMASLLEKSKNQMQEEVDQIQTEIKEQKNILKSITSTL